MNKNLLLVIVVTTLSMDLLSVSSPTKKIKINYGAQSMIAPLQHVLVQQPGKDFGEADPEKWGYTGPTNLPRAQDQHYSLVKLLRSLGVEVSYAPNKPTGHADSIYVHDPVLITKRGSIILRMGKSLRRGEEANLENTLLDLGIPTLYKMKAPGTAEGGDTLWLDENTLLVGRSYRTNSAGIEQLREALKPLDVNVIAFDLPYFEGKEACLHLQSLISLVDEKVAVVYPYLMPVALRELLEERAFTLIEVPEEEFLTMGPNILAVRPGVVLTIEGNPITKARMEACDIEVRTYEGDEVSLTAEGGATCLTRPLFRQYPIVSPEL